MDRNAELIQLGLNKEVDDSDQDSVEIAIEPPNEMELDGDTRGMQQLFFKCSLRLDIIAFYCIGSFRCSQGLFLTLMQ